MLVTDWDPLTIWFYEECYVRFAAEDYEYNKVGNKFSHLTNNSIAKYSKSDEAKIIDGNMWDVNQFNDYLKGLTGKDMFFDKIKPDMKKIAKYSCQAAQDVVEARKNSHELFGYDFMVDENMNTWLIEINSSPAMDYSTVSYH